MKDTSKAIVDRALELPENERAEVVEQLLLSLDKPNPDIEEQWAIEVESRIDAYDRGEIRSVPADEVFAKHRRK